MLIYRIEGTSFSVLTDTTTWNVLSELEYFQLTTYVHSDNLIDKIKILVLPASNIGKINTTTDNVYITDTQYEIYKDKVVSKPFLDFLDYLKCNMNNESILVDMESLEVLYSVTNKKVKSGRFVDIKNMLNNAEVFRKKLKSVGTSVDMFFIWEGNTLYKYSDYEPLYYLAIKQQLQLLITKDAPFNTSWSSKFILNYMKVHYDIELDSTLEAFIRIRGKVLDTTDNYLPRLRSEYIDKLGRTKLSKAKKHRALEEQERMMDEEADKKEAAEKQITTEDVIEGKIEPLEKPAEITIPPTLLLSDIIDGKHEYSATLHKYIVSIDTVLPYDIEKMYYDGNLKKLFVYQGKTVINLEQIKKILDYDKIVLVVKGALLQTKEDANVAA